MRTNFLTLTVLIFSFLVVDSSAFASDSDGFDLLGVKIGENATITLDTLQNGRNKMYVTEMNQTKITDRAIKYKSGPIHVGYKLVNVDERNRKSLIKAKGFRETIYVLNDLHRSRSSQVLGVSRSLVWKYGMKDTPEVLYKDVKASLIKKYGDPDYYDEKHLHNKNIESGCYLLWGGPIDKRLKGKPKAVIDSSAAVIENIIQSGGAGYLKNEKLFTNEPFIGCRLFNRGGNPELMNTMTCVMLDPAKFNESIDDFTSFIESEKSEIRKAISQKASSNKLDY